jgi:hypothetical protein
MYSESMSNSNIKVLENRLIAFLDVLGFQDRMKRESPERLVEIYGEFIKEANEQVFGNDAPSDIQNCDGNFAATKFVFDSIVLVSHPIDSSQNISKFILATIVLMEKAMQDNLPLRGAISKSSFVEDIKNNLFVSDAFKSLSKFEASIDFSGCCILSDVADEILIGINGGPLKSNQDLKRFPMVLYPVPQKNGNVTDMWCLNWIHMFPRNKLQASIDYLIEPKKQNTQEFVDFVAKLKGEDKQSIETFGETLFVRYMGTTNQCRLQFIDSDENPANPPSKGFEIRLDAEL